VWPSLGGEPETPAIQAARFETNPLITAATSGAGSNICGPSVIRVPDWVNEPLGRYYMYFARHMSSDLDGAYIRLAYADHPEGPWTVHQTGALRRSQLKDIARNKAAGKPIRKRQHIASPDVHVDDANKRIILYFHGSYRGHNTGAAVSPDGINFDDLDVDLGYAYLRMFSYEGTWYGISQTGGRGGGGASLKRFDSLFGAHRSRVLIPDELPRFRHGCVLVRGGQLIVLYTRMGDEPERVLAAFMDLNGDWLDWELGVPQEVLRPARKYEGSDLPLAASRPGSGRNKHELRDPYIFEDADGKLYLYYTIKGESGIAGARLTIR
jgi:hypothetical protein